MSYKPKLIALFPFIFILFGAQFIYCIRFFDELSHYEQNLTYAQPILGFFYILTIYYCFIKKESAGGIQLGLAPDRLKLAASLILGLVAGIFFFLVYFGAHPNRQFPGWPVFIYFNSYLLFISFSEELIFRVWAMNSFRRGFSIVGVIVLSATGYTIACFATIGRDLSSVVAGEIDPFLIFETLFRSFTIGLILAVLFLVTKSIYGNILFILISTIPIYYEKNGMAFKGNSISAILSLMFFAVFFLILIIQYRKRLNSVCPVIT